MRFQAQCLADQVSEHRPDVRTPVTLALLRVDCLLVLSIRMKYDAYSADGPDLVHGREDLSKDFPALAD